MEKLKQCNAAYSINGWMNGYSMSIMINFLTIQVDKASRYWGSHEIFHNF